MASGHQARLLRGLGPPRGVGIVKKRNLLGREDNEGGREA